MAPRGRLPHYETNPIRGRVRLGDASYPASRIQHGAVSAWSNCFVFITKYLVTEEGDELGGELCYIWLYFWI
jgi:hypothetical protein